MNYQEFLEHRQQLRRAQPQLLDLGETNLWLALGHLVPQLPGVAPVHHHRCDLARAWTEVFRQPADHAKRALVSRGVRHSLSLLFPGLREQVAEVWLPADVYPVYGELAQAAGLRCFSFPTIPELVLPERGDCLLLPNPLKPLGRWLRSDEVAAILSWLAAAPRRRLLLDAVYTFATDWHDTTQALLASGQCILLHSLSKGWLRPQVFGTALFPEADVDRFLPAFRAHPPSQANLAEAAWLLSTRRSLPGEVAQALQWARAKVLAKLRPALAAEVARRLDDQGTSYLVAVPWSAAELLAREGLLAIPATVFGSTCEDWSILSVLSHGS